MSEVNKYLILLNILNILSLFKVKKKPCLEQHYRESIIIFGKLLLKTVERCLFEFEADCSSYLSIVGGEDEGLLITAADGGRQELILVSHPNTSTLRQRQT